MVLRRFTRDKKVEGIVKFTKGKSTSRINEIKNDITEVCLNLNINFDNNKWNNLRVKTINILFIQ